MAETIKGINIKLSLDGKDLDSELKNINKNLREQQRDLRAINQNLRYDPTNLDLWKKKQHQVNELLTITKSKLDTQKAALEKAHRDLKLGNISETEFRKLQRNITYTEADIKRLNKELKESNDKIKSLGNAKFDELAKLGGTLTKSVTGPILAAVAALSAFAKKGIDTSEELTKLSNKLGISIEALQEWNHVAKASGVEASTIEKAFEKVNNVVASIALGDVKSFAGVFHSLGLDMNELSGKNAEEAFDIIRRALNNVEDESLRAALANHLFGDKLGNDLIPILRMSTDEVEGLKDEARSLGLITEEQSDYINEYSNKITNLKESFSNLSVEVAMVMIPLFEKVVDYLQNKLIPFTKGLIDKWNSLDDGTKKIIVTITGLVAAIGPLLTIVGKVVPIVKVAAAGLKAVGSSGLFAGVGLNAATLGIGALVAIVVMALMKSEKFKELLEKLMEVFQRLLEPIIDLIEVLMDSLMPIVDIIVNIFMKLVDILVPLIDMILEPLINQLDFLASLFELLSPLIEMVGNILKSTLVPAFKMLETILTPIFKLLEKIIKFFEKIFNFAGSIGDVVNDAFGGIVGKVGDVISGVGNFASGVIGKVSDFAGGITSKVSSFTSGIFSGISNAVSGVVNKVSDFTKDTVSKVSDVAKNVGSAIGDFASSAKDKVSGVIGSIGGFFSNAFNLKGSSNTTNTSNTSNSTTNTITINTSSPTFDIDSINKALGGKFIWERLYT